LPQIAFETLDKSSTALIQQHLQTVRRQPRSGAAWGRLGSLLRSFEFKAEAQYCLAIASRLDPREPRWPYYRGMLLVKQAPAEALPLLQRAVALCGNTPSAPRLRLATLLAENGRSDEARRELSQLLEANPRDAPALMALAHLESVRGKTTEALFLADRCTNDTRTARAAWTLRSTLLQRQGDAATARAAAQRASSLPADAPLDDPFENEVMLVRNDPRALSDQAQRFLMAGQLTNVVPLLQQLVRDHPDFAETWLLVGRMQLLQRQPAEAEESLRRHLKLEPRSASGQFQLGLALLMQERYAAAVPAFVAATELKPDFGAAFFNLGVAFAKSGRKQEALAPFREAIRHNPERIDSYILLADLDLELGQRSEAIQLARQAEALNPADRRVPQLWNKIGPR
jgi:tetratricopeptide (TPR) repeat protein